MEIYHNPKTEMKAYICKAKSGYCVVPYDTQIKKHGTGVLCFTKKEAIEMAELIIKNIPVGAARWKHNKQIAPSGA